MGVVAHCWRIDRVALKKALGDAGILAEDQVYFFENTKRSQGNILKVADGGAHYVKHRFCHIFICHMLLKYTTLVPHARN